MLSKAIKVNRVKRIDFIFYLFHTHQHIIFAYRSLTRDHHLFQVIDFVLRFRVRATTLI